VSRVHIIATGGTIAMASSATGSRAVLALSGEDLRSRLLGLQGAPLPQISTEEYGPLPSSHFTVQHLLGLRERVLTALGMADVQGIVLTHGTDTLEETAYLLDCTVPGDKPIVLTGAMRLASDPGYEGMANLTSAVRVAASADARSLGALVVMNDEVHAARDVTKIHSQSQDTFKSLSLGPLGRVDADRVRIDRRLERDVLAFAGLEPSVYLLKLAVGMDAELLLQAVRLGAKGVVIECFGGGRVPPWWLEPIQEALRRGAVVVIATRCPTGPLHDQYGFRGAYHDLASAGCLFAHNLNGQKARIRLMAALGAGANAQRTSQLFCGKTISAHTATT
jgi:L-asparaginase